MIQRVQSLFLLLVITLNIFIFFDSDRDFLINSLHLIPQDYIELIPGSENEFAYSSIFILLSTALSIIALFMFKNRLLQLKLIRFSRFSLGIVLIISYFFESLYLFIGYAPLLLPWLLLIVSSYFIKKDEKLVRSADRIR
tara:strand:+ start:403 stop:822 length:420 start_codon:yes stop_codon:yes gene_type:complete